jgi:hypothetical protein
MTARKAKSARRLSGRSAGRPKKFTAYLEASVSCKEVMEAFDKAKVKYKSHSSYFSPNTADPTWLPFVGRHGWVLLTTDDKMPYRLAEKHAILTFKVRSFVFQSHMRGDEMARYLVRMMPAMRRFCGKHEKPFIGYLQPSGGIKLLLDKTGLVHD